MPARYPLLSLIMNEYVMLTKARRGEGATYQQDKQVLGLFLRITGDKQARNVTAQHIEQFFYGPGGIRDWHVTTSRRTTQGKMPPVSESTHNHYRSRLMVFVTWAVHKGYMKSGLVDEAFNKSTGVVRPLKVPKVQRQRPTPATLLAFLEKASNARDRAYLATAVNTALRASEIRNMKVKDVDLDAGYIYVTIQKTGDVDDQPITLDLDRELRVWLTTYAKDLGRPLHGDDYLFPRRRGGLISHYEVNDEGERVMVRQPYVWVPDWPIRETHKIVQHCLKEMGLPTTKEGTHTIRRAVALAYFQEAAKERGDVAALRETSALLHHSSTATTEIYLGMTPEKNRRNHRMRGKPFLSTMVQGENVVPLRRAATGE